MRLPRFVALVIVAAGLVISSQSIFAKTSFDQEHADLTHLLKRHVQWQSSGHASVVDYAGLQKDRAPLKAYLQQLAGVSMSDFNSWRADQRTAFLINAYNAWTLELILTAYPDIASIKDLGGLFSSPWKQSIANLLGATRSLDDIEHGLLRGAKGFNEPRIHFAVNCASIGCPALRPEAYTADALDAQLADQTQRFLSDRSRNRVSDDGKTLVVSKLFDWYADDFKAPASPLAAPKGFLATYASALSDDAATQQKIGDGTLALDFLDYDWALNGLGKK